MIKAEMNWIAVLEQQLGIFVNEHPSHPGYKSSLCVKNVIVDGVISHDDNMVKKAIKNFWESLLSTKRPYNKDSLMNWLLTIILAFPQLRDMMLTRRKLINFFREPITLAQDLMVFSSLYISNTRKVFWHVGELIQQAGEIMEFPPSFGESQLCLISKVKNIPCPDQFQPISVTNSDYWIVMRYWAKWLMEIASGVFLKNNIWCLKGDQLTKL